MRVGFNAFFLHQESTGSGQYAVQLLRALCQMNPSDEYLLYATRRSAEGPSDLRKLCLPSQRRLSTPFDRLSENLDKLWFEQVAFPRACTAARADVAHIPYFAGPAFVGVPTVVTIHDLIPLLLPAYRRSVTARLYTLLVATAAKRADVIITDSLASKRDIELHLSVPPERVQVIYLAVDPECRPVADPTILAAASAKYGLPTEYILYLGGFDQRKNLRTLLAAYARLCHGAGSEVPPLVVAGRLPSVHSRLFPHPKRLASELGIEQRVVFTGWVAEEDKPALYTGALFYAFLSLYEGFGLMPLEALSCGTPVLAANCTSLPEVVGEGGLLVDPRDVEDVALGMARLLRDSALRRQLSEAALRQSARFDWNRTAEQTVRAYEQAAARSRREPGTEGPARSL